MHGCYVILDLLGNWFSRKIHNELFLNLDDTFGCNRFVGGNLKSMTLCFIQPSVPCHSNLDIH